MDDVLDTKIGSPIQTAIVKAIYLEQRIPDKNGNLMPKVVIIVENAMNSFRVDEAWVPDRYGTVRPQGLWHKVDFQGKLICISALAKVLVHFKVETLRELIGREVQLLPKPNGFLALMATDGLGAEEAPEDDTQH